MAASATATASLSSIPPSSPSISSSLTLRARLIHHSPKPKPSKSLTLTSRTLSLPHLHILPPAAQFRSAAASDDLDFATGDESEPESVLSVSEADQLLEQIHEEEEQEQEGEVEEEEGKKKAASVDDGRLYVGNLPYSITSSQLSEIFAEAGAVRSVEIMYDRVTDRSRGFAFVTMESVEDAENAIRMLNSYEIGGRAMKVNFPEVPRGGERKVLEPKIKTSYQSFVETPHKVYAGNLSWSLTSQGLRDAFSDQPGCLSAKVIYERETGRSRGFGFISFSSAEEARSAIQALNGVEMEGRPLRLNFSSERPRASPPPEEFSLEESAEETAAPVEPSSEESVEGTEILSGV